MNHWAAQELELLRHCWPSLDHHAGTGWCRIPDFAIPAGWNKQAAEIAFQIPDNLPGQEPYAFLVRDGLLLANNSTPSNYSPNVTTPPWGGNWGQFSWNLDPWAPGPKPGTGSSMVDFVRSITGRLRELS
ncbi:hypothetical protein ACFQY4_05395 [Catellatospora bangladeshensis]|uniref:Uncharacterized protein n=1 Tax=Catellatospora bangladeshensis TaxID=310355 RepID=A0A8J3JID1_9ACTN|nr:hypothetical protein [Catellatospora bangladeshensis]GIF83144.1 hypothetical protein Cba03nite_44930 [Catellatospora bangladeshensis]